MANYDKTSPVSIFEYSKKILGKTLREYIGNGVLRSRRGKGRLGQLVEDYLFKYKTNNRQEADFAEAGLELKCAPLKKDSSGRLCIKERLVCTMIDFSSVLNESFENSHLLKKCRLMLLLFYLHLTNRDVADLKFLFSVLWLIPEKDLLIIRNDYETIVEKIRNGKAHEISEGDTEYLGACRKGSGGAERKVPQPRSDIPAFRRAFALKTAYMRTILAYVENSHTVATSNFNSAPNDEIISVEELREKKFEEIILDRFRSFQGKTARTILEAKGIPYNPQNKARYARAASAVITDKIANANKSEEFLKSGIEIKTVRLSKAGVPEEALSFENIDYQDVWNRKNEGWTSSRWYEICTGRFLLVVFRETDKKEISYGKEIPLYVLEKVSFWTMPPEDLATAKKFWHNILENIKNRTTASTHNHFWKDGDKNKFHVRPKGRTASDKTDTPFESETSKMCYWFNRDYVKSIVSRL